MNFTTCPGNKAKMKGNHKGIIAMLCLPCLAAFWPSYVFSYFYVYIYINKAYVYK